MAFGERGEYPKLSGKDILHKNWPVWYSFIHSFFIFSSSEKNEA